LDVSLGAHFQKVINLSESGAKLTNEITEKIEIAMRSHPGPNQVYVILFGGNNMRKTTKPALEVAKIVSRFRRIMAEAQKAKVRVLLCGTIPDPRPAVDSKLKLLDEALKDLEMGQGNNFLGMRAMMLDAQGQVRKDLYKPNRDIHLNSSGTKIISLRIQRMLEIMLPALVPGRAPVQAPVPAPVVNAPLAVNVPLVAAVVQAPVVVQHVAVVGQGQVESMETD
jgi:lysophospholipase L1-like esterase